MFFFSLPVVWSLVNKDIHKGKGSRDGLHDEETDQEQILNDMHQQADMRGRYSMV